MKTLITLFALLVSLNLFGTPSTLSKSILLNETGTEFDFALNECSSASDLYSFFTQETIGLVGFMAHPTSTFSHGNVSIRGENVYVNIWYKEGEAMELCFKYSYGLFTGVRVITDTDYFPAFLAITGMKEIFESIIDEMNEEEREILTEFERYMGKVWDDFEGEDLTCMLLTIGSAIN